ncbi:MAG: glycosyltransferase family 2 protein [Actinobacteria bacterium]|nr:glycosyltransferase family 2 protein [Actinomycetota bacterium]
MSTEPQAVAPPVVAVVVTRDAGPWLEEALAALGAQDYPNLSMLVVDDGGVEDPTARVAGVLPTAYVRRLPERRGFAAAANEVLHVVEGASHFLFCHDDVAPDGDAVRLLVEEAFRSNAGIVAPKLVDWAQPERLLQVGMSIDKSGAPALLVERGELDQEQHDAVRDVFVAPGGATLVRADLFATLGGFDEVMHLYGEDLDLSWRAQIAGARVVVAPGARVRHLEATSSGRRGAAPGERVDLEALRDEVRPLQLRHRLRAVLKNYSTFHLVRVLPQIALLAVGEFLYGLLTGRRGTSRDIVGAWRWNLSKQQRADIRQRRRAVKQVRAFPDSEVRRLQVRGSARMTAFVRGQLAADGRLRRRAPVLGAAPRLAAGAGTGDALRLPLAVMGVLAAVLLFGSRDLLGGRLSAVGQLAPFPEGPWPLLRDFFSGWRSYGLGSSSPAPPAFAFLGLAGTVLLGAMGVLQKLLVLGMVPLGLVGMFRLTKPLASRRARLVAVVVYAAVPLPYNDIARGHWRGLLLYGAFPWLLARLLRATGLEPFGDRSSWRDHVLPLGVLVAVVTAFVPSAPIVLVLTALAVVLGAALAGEARDSARMIGLSLGATGVAVVLLFPWSLDFALPGSEWAALTGVDAPAGRAFGLGALMRFETGPLGAPPLGWAFMVAATLPLVIGRSWRLQWAARSWVLALSFWGVAWAGGRDWIDVPLPANELLLVPAAVALAMSTALGMAAFEIDLPRYRFGWRQGVSLAAATAVFIGAVPVLLASVGGRWHQPRQDFDHLLSWMEEQREQGDFRVLWLGDPEAVPMAGWRLRDGVAYGASHGGAPTLADQWPAASSGAAGLLADAVELATAGETTKIGRLLAPTAVRYVVVPSKASPSRDRTRLLPPPPGLVDALDAQIDLRLVASDPSLRVYENAAWIPVRAALGEGAVAASRTEGVDELLEADLGGSTPVLERRRSDTRFEGEVPAGSEVYLSSAASGRWDLRVDGRSAPRRTAFGWANAYSVADGGPATLRYRTSPLRWAAIAIQVALWVYAVRALGRRRRDAGEVGPERSPVPAAEAVPA